ncbi:quinone oxidoreductase, NADPH-dependent [Escherichia coli]|nr:quinone oxidoreductase, NADPH-dependent [Escherichia coli]
MSKVITFNRTGGPEVLEFVDVQVPAPTAGEVQIRVHAIGINRAEIMYRNGQYVIEPEFPARLGYEAAGVVQAVGENVDEFTIGDLVSVIPSFMFNEYGMYGEVVNAPVHAIVKHPENLSFEEAAASWMMYVTAYGALVEYGNLQAGQNVVIRAASSSVGLAAIQIANMLGANPIALTRTSEKSEMLLKAGAAAVIATAELDMVAEINRTTDGVGAHIVFDPVGGPDVAKTDAGDGTTWHVFPVWRAR